jgi:glutaredoxin 3
MKLAIYTKVGCPYCDKIKTVFNAKGWSYAEYVLDRDFNREQFYAQFGNGATFPRVLKDDLSLGGCTESIQYFRSQGLL